jgi:hypothetical protein
LDRIVLSVELQLPRRMHICRNVQQESLCPPNMPAFVLKAKSGLQHENTGHAVMHLAAVRWPTRCG